MIVDKFVNNVVIVDIIIVNNIICYVPIETVIIIIAIDEFWI